jgi:hypothetical protein
MTASSSSGNSNSANQIDVGQVGNNQLVDITKVDQSNVKYFVVDGKLQMFEQVGANVAAGIQSEATSNGANSSTSSKSEATAKLRAFHWEKATDDQAAEYNKSTNQGSGKVGAQSGNSKVAAQSSNGKVTNQSSNSLFTSSNNNNLYVKHYDDSIKAA